MKHLSLYLPLANERSAAQLAGNLPCALTTVAVPRHSRRAARRTPKSSDTHSMLAVFAASVAELVRTAQAVQSYRLVMTEELVIVIIEELVFVVIRTAERASQALGPQVR